MANDRPDDIGEQFPGANPTVPSPVINRAPVDYQIRTDAVRKFPYNVPLAVAAGSLAGKLFIINSVTDELIFANEVFNNDGVLTVSDEITYVAKPFELRKSTYNGTVDADGYTRTAVTATQRLLTLDGNEITENITPDYSIGGYLLAVESEASGVTGVKYIDANVDARRWVPESSSSLIYAHWRGPAGNQVLSDSQLEEILWQNGSLVESVGSGFSLEAGGSGIEVKAAADGKLVGMSVNVKFDNQSQFQDVPRAGVIIHKNAADLFGTSTLANDESDTSANQILGSDATFRLSCYKEFRVADGDLLEVYARCYRFDQNNVTVLGAKTEVSIRVLPGS